MTSRRPFAGGVQRFALVALVIAAVSATVWVAFGRVRSEGAERTAPTRPPTSSPDSSIVSDALSAPSPIDRGDVTVLTGTGPLPPGWHELSGEWATDGRGAYARASGIIPAVAVAPIEALPWATITLTGSPVEGWGVAFGVKDALNHYAIEVSDGAVRLVEVIDGMDLELVRSALPPADVMVTLDVTDRLVGIRVGGEVIDVVQVASSDAARRIGVRLGPDGDAAARWTTIGVNPRPRMGAPLVARGLEVEQVSPRQAAQHLGP